MAERQQVPSHTTEYVSMMQRSLKHLIENLPADVKQQEEIRNPLKTLRILMADLENILFRQSVEMSDDVREEVMLASPLRHQDSEPREMAPPPPPPSGRSESQRPMTEAGGDPAAVRRPRAKPAKSRKRAPKPGPDKLPWNVAEMILTTAHEVFGTNDTHPSSLLGPENSHPQAGNSTSVAPDPQRTDSASSNGQGEEPMDEHDGNGRSNGTTSHHPSSSTSDTGRRSSGVQPEPGGSNRLENGKGGKQSNGQAVHGGADLTYSQAVGWMLASHDAQREWILGLSTAIESFEEEVANLDNPRLQSACEDMKTLTVKLNTFRCVQLITHLYGPIQNRPNVEVRGLLLKYKRDFLGIKDNWLKILDKMLETKDKEHFCAKYYKACADLEVKGTGTQ